MWKTTPQNSAQGAKLILIMWTAPHLDEARLITKALVAQKLVASASLFPLVESYYIWEGQMQQVSEVQVILKTSKDRFQAVEQFIRARHSYKVAEIIAMPITSEHAPYLKWVEASLK